MMKGDAIMSSKRGNKGEEDTNLIRAVVEHVRGSVKPRVKFDFVAKGLLLSGVFLMGLAPSVPTYANTKTVTPTSVTSEAQVSKVKVNIQEVESYSELYADYTSKLNLYASFMENAMENNVYSTSGIGAIDQVLTKIAKDLNDGKIPTEQGDLIKALERASLSTYFDEAHFGFELAGKPKEIKDSVDKQFDLVYSLLGKKQVASGGGATVNGSSGVETNTATVRQSAIDVVKVIADNCETHFSPVFSKGTILEDKVVEAYGKGSHSAECIDYVAQTYTDSTFKDVNYNAWYKEGVANSYQLKLMGGESDKKFNPTGNLTVAQTIAIASRLNSIYTTGNLGAIPDVKGGKWYDGVVKYAQDNGIIKSSDFSASAMNKPATRGQVAYILGNSVPSKELGVINKDAKFADVTSKTAYSDSILNLAKAGVLAGKTDTEFKASDVVTRAEASVIITRLVRPSSRIEVTTVAKPVTSGKTVYVTQVDKNGIQQVYDKPGAGLTAINVKYGRHTYNCNNQKEYDFVVSEIEKILKFEGTGGKEYKQLLEDYKTDKNKTHYKAMDSAYKLGIKDENKIFEIYKINKVCAIARTLGGAKTQKGDTAYTLMKNGDGDCTASAMVNSAVMDIMGYNSKTVASDSQNHEWAVMYYEGKWLHLVDSGLVKAMSYNRNTTNDTFNNAK